MDCLFTGPQGLTIVDFKTDHLRQSELEEHSRQYQNQLDSYTWAVEQIFGQPVQRRVLWYFRLGKGYVLPGKK